MEKSISQEIKNRVKVFHDNDLCKPDPRTKYQASMNLPLSLIKKGIETGEIIFFEKYKNINLDIQQKNSLIANMLTYGIKSRTLLNFTDSKIRLLDSSNQILLYTEITEEEKNEPFIFEFDKIEQEYKEALKQVEESYNMLMKINNKPFKDWTKAIQTRFLQCDISAYIFYGLTEAEEDTQSYFDRNPIT